MKKLARCLAVGLTLTAGAATASESVGSWYITPLGFGEWTAEERLVDDDFAYGLAIGKAVSEKLNIELNVTSGKFDGVGGDELTLNAYGINFMPVFYRESRISAFLLLGVGSHEANYEISENTSDYYADVGAGVLATLTRSSDHSSSFSLRGEVRSRHTFLHGDERIVDYMAGIGLQFAFGGRPIQTEAAPAEEPVAAAAAATTAAVAAADPDSDGDGVLDSRDKCPGTAAGIGVDTVGCELDTDGDGILDSKDSCPKTPKGDKVDAAGCSVTLRLEVLFETNSDQLTAESRTYLDTLAARLNELTNVSGVIEGHTDSTGAESYNQSLSERRAKTVRDYLVSKGVAGSRLQSAGLGESKPIADNSTEAGRAQNRRVVLRRTDAGAQ